jgi:hypothetical protein
LACMQLSTQVCCARAGNTQIGVSEKIAPKQEISSKGTNLKVTFWPYKMASVAIKEVLCERSGGKTTVVQRMICITCVVATGNRNFRFRQNQ